MSDCTCIITNPDVPAPPRTPIADCDEHHNNYICPMCRKPGRKAKHNLCDPSWCGCKHKRKARDPKSPSTSVHTTSAGLPTLGKRR